MPQFPPNDSPSTAASLYTSTPWTDANGAQWTSMLVATGIYRWQPYSAPATGGGSSAWDDLTGVPAAVTALSGTNTGDQTNITGNAATVTTNANLTGHVTSTGNAAVLGSFTIAQLQTAISDADVVTRDGVQTITGLKSFTTAGFETTGCLVNFAVGTTFAFEGGAITSFRNNIGLGTASSVTFGAITGTTITGTTAIIGGTGAFTTLSASGVITATSGVSLPGGGTVTGASGAVTIAASGTNQNINLTPSGTGVVSTTAFNATSIGATTPGTIAGTTISASGALTFTAGGSVAPSSDRITLNGSTYLIFQAGGVQLGYFQAGGDFNLSCRILFAGDNQRDIGAAATSRPRDLNLGRNAAIGGTLAVTGASTFGSGTAIAKIRHGNATLAAGTVTVTDTAITASSRIYINRFTDGGTLGDSYSVTRSATANFTVTSKTANATQTADTSVITYLIIEP